MKTILALLFAAAVPLQAQTRADSSARPPVKLTLEAAVKRALGEGEEMRSAQAQYRDTQGQVREALSGALPQVSGSVTYSRQFASIYQGLGGGTGADSGLGDLFKNSPFGAANAWNFSVTASQLLFSAGKVSAGLKAARAARFGARDWRSAEAAGLAPVLAVSAAAARGFAGLAPRRYTPPATASPSVRPNSIHTQPGVACLRRPLRLLFAMRRGF